MGLSEESNWLQIVFCDGIYSYTRSIEFLDSGTKGTRINDEGLSMFILSQGVKDLVLSTEHVKSKSCDSARESGISSCIAWPNTIQNTGDGWM